MCITIQVSLFKNLQCFYLKIHIEEYYDKDMTTLDRCLKICKILQPWRFNAISIQKLCI